MHNLCAQIKSLDMSKTVKRNIHCCGSGKFIPDPTFFHPGSRIHGQKISGSWIWMRIPIKEFRYFNPKIVSKLSEIWSEMNIPDPDLTHPGSRIQGVKRQRIRNTYLNSAVLVRHRVFNVGYLTVTLGQLHNYSSTIFKARFALNTEKI